LLASLSQPGFGQGGLPSPWNAPRGELAAVHDERILTHSEWAARLVDALGLAESLPLDHTEDDLFSLLCPDRAERDVQAGGRSVPTRPPFQVTLENPRSAGHSEPLRLVFAAPATALYTLRVHGVGAGRWYADRKQVGILDSTLLGQDVAGSVIPLAKGPHELEAHLAAGAQISRIELEAERTLCIAPAEGWQGQRELSFGDKARTLVQAFGLLKRLPVEEEIQVIEGEHFHTASASGVRTNLRLAVPASADAWAVARGRSTEFSYRVSLSTPGLFSILVRIHGSERQIWSVDGRYATRIFPPPQASDFAWTEVATIPLGAGKHVIRALVPPGAGVDVVQLLRRRTDDEDFLRILEALGLEEGAPLEPVSVAAASRNLRSNAFQLFTASLLKRDSGAAHDRLALVEHELEQLFTRPLSPVLPPDL
jgi:hypothetical protein